MLFFGAFSSAEIEGDWVCSDLDHWFGVLDSLEERA